MRILVSTMIYPNSQERTRGIYNHWQVKELAKRGHQVRVFAPLPYAPPLLGRYGYLRRIPKAESIDGIEIEHPRFFTVPGLPPFVVPLVYGASLHRALERAVKAFRPDVILGFWALPDGASNAFLARKLSVPCVLGCLGSDVNVYSERASTGFWLNYAFSRSDAVVCVSQALKDVILERCDPGETPVLVVRNGVDKEVFKPTERAEARKELGVDGTLPVVLFVGRLSDEKRVADLLDAVAMLPADRRVGVVIVGDGPEAAHLKERAIALHHAGVEVVFAGPQPPAKVALWMSAANLLVLPSEREGCPNVVIESLACGTRVLGSRVGGIPELLNDEILGGMVPPRSPKELALALGAMLAEDYGQEEVASHPSIRAWSDVAEELERILTDAKGRRRAHI